MKKKYKIGTWIITNSPAGVDVISKSGFDFVCIDLEHSSIGYEELNSLLIILDKNKVVVDYLSWDNVFASRKKITRLDKVPIVVMAGGKGDRLIPFTKVLPKPLIPVNEKPVIEHIIEKFTSFGAKKFYITTNYKSRILKSFFKELQPSYSVKFFDEIKPLGTIGGLRNHKKNFKGSFFVTNCDIIINSNCNYIVGRTINNSPLAHIPPLNANLNIEYNIKNNSINLNTSYNSWKKAEDYDLAGVDNLEEATIDGTPSWYTLNLYYSYKLDNNFTYGIGIKNIFDVHYKTFGSALSASGRNFVLSLHAKF